MDLFENEQVIYEKALNHVNDVYNGSPFSFEEFETLVRKYGRMLRYLRMVTKVSDKTTIRLYENNKELFNKVHIDMLTGIYNRRFFEENIKRNIKELSRSESFLSILLLDIDFFKNYNDTYGHSLGDVCLKLVAETLLESVTREDDFVARYGGEEFVIVLPHTDERGAHITAGKVLEKILERAIPHGKSDVANCVTVSIGVTSIKVKHNHNSTDYIKTADKALYKSKENGRNRYTYIEFKEAAG